VVARTTGTGRYVASEGDMTIVANSYSTGGPLVLVCHGAGASALTYGPLAQRRDLNLLAESGCVVVCADLGGANTWGNDTFLTRVDQVRTWAAANLGADLSRMVMIGRSMGGMGALNYAWRNPTLVKGVVLQAPVVAADALHDRDLAGIGALIDTAYGGGAAWDTAKPNRDPSATAPAALIAELKDKYRIWYSTTDAVVLPADIDAFVALTGVRAIPLGAVTHDDTSIAAAIHAQSQAEWLWSRIAA
jgi:pimeloyl-ACP methyl ester carboxylesterase